MTQEQVAVTAEKIRAGKTSLGIEFGSTRIKAVLIDDAYHTIAAGDYEWASHLEDGLWSYTQEEIWKGLQTAYARMAGDVDYMLRVVTADMQSYDVFYKKLISAVALKNVTSRFAMEKIKSVTALPVPPLSAA